MLKKEIKWSMRNRIHFILGVLDSALENSEQDRNSVLAVVRNEALILEEQIQKLMTKQDVLND